MQQDPTSHNTCTTEECARSNIDRATYQQAHVCDGRQCQKLLPDPQKVTRILRENEIPIMSLEELNGEPRLTVSGSFKALPGDYIAISHVWADGIRGSTETGLNLCQIEQLLSGLCHSDKLALPTTRFGLDCLCIPRPESDSGAYIQALVGIRNVYINASSVLVVDKTIEECILSSSTRISVLAKELIFVLKDGFHTYKVNNGPSMRRTVCVVWQSIAAQLYRLRAKQGQLNIEHIHQELRYRLTNAWQEEYLSVSGMSGLDTQSLLEVKGEERTKKFWLMLKWIPFNVPFLDCPKLSQQGFRWAPRTMMHPSRTLLDTELEGQKSECTKSGLVGTYPTVAFDNFLKGSAEKSESISYVWSSPKPPDSHVFDTVMLASETKTIMSAGEWVPAAAFYRQDRADEDPQASSASKSASTLRTFREFESARNLVKGSRRKLQGRF
ncbi:uncharacterized protein PAC_19204 [Phialocephala subalpina]|uniref:Heterokaryon incompatibility domain-containing protein n=1 Tax=Phialocephala subalpina TaxID=576137 RepID=A0A1L7XW88_9HELO|nr:uncharacterized protein PAC_19204 [Phialocephala subalpina]